MHLVPGNSFLKLPALALATAGLVVTACGASHASPTQASTPVPTSTAAGRQAEFAKIQQCLQQAGLSVPGPRPSGVPQGDPSAQPSPGQFGPARGGRGGGGAGRFNDPQVQAALKKCGITPPSGPPSS